LFAEAAYYDSSIPNYHFFHGKAMSLMGKYKDAEMALNRALKGDPANPEIFAELGFIYLKLRMTKLAKASFERALRLDPTHSRAGEALSAMDPDA
jgi:Flp pilus assembly protein TadD